MKSSLGGPPLGENLFSEVETEGMTSFKCHKIVLAAYSSFFYTMFTNGFKDSSRSTVTLEVRHLNSYIDLYLF